jgi:hypothetical protein
MATPSRARITELKAVARALRPYRHLPATATEIASLFKEITALRATRPLKPTPQVSRKHKRRSSRERP